MCELSMKAADHNKAWEDAGTQGCVVPTAIYDSHEVCIHVDVKEFFTKML